ncbi:MAG: DoxX family protein [Nostocoides sp.]
MSLVRKVARPMLAAMFIKGGYDAFMTPGPRAAQAAPLLARVAGPLGLPNDPELLVRANGLAMVGSGALLALGRFPRLAAAVLGASLVPTTLTGHAFWKETDPATRKQQQTHFLKNVSMVGGLLLAAVDTEGKPGLAYRAGMASDAAGRVARSGRREARHLAKAARREARLVAFQAKAAVS